MNRDLEPQVLCRCAALWRIVVLVACTLLIARSTRAQEAGKVGVLVSTPTSVGAIWHVSERLAIQPTVNLAWQSIESENSYDIDPQLLAAYGGIVLYAPDALPADRRQEQSSTGITLQITVRWRLAQWGSLRGYVAPSFGRQWSSTSNSGAGFVPASDDTNYQVSGMAGVQYELDERFGLFGEAGLGYSHFSTRRSVATLPGIGSTQESVYRSLATVGRVGFVFYFKR